MNDFKKVIAALIFWTFLIFVMGLYLGSKSTDRSAEREIIELSIELKKLEIKKHKAAVKPATKDGCTENDIYKFCSGK